MLFLIPVGPVWMRAASFIRARGTLVLARQLDRASDLLGEELVHISDDLFDNCFVGPFAPAVVSSAEVKTMAEAGVFHILNVDGRFLHERQEKRLVQGLEIYFPGMHLFPLGGCYARLRELTMVTT